MRSKLFLIAFITLAGNGILGYFVFKSNQNRLISEYWVRHTMQVGYRADKLLATENQLSTALKAFTLTKDTTFLKPLYSAQKSILQNLQQLTLLTRDNSLQQQRLLSLTVSMRQFLMRSFNKQG